jgi:hypothetical protein
MAVGSRGQPAPIGPLLPIEEIPDRFDGCLDPRYVFGFIWSYGMMIFLPLTPLIGLLRAIPVRPLN